jgi:hypothetical protein
MGNYSEDELENTAEKRNRTHFFSLRHLYIYGFAIQFFAFNLGENCLPQIRILNENEISIYFFGIAVTLLGLFVFARFKSKSSLHTVDYGKYFGVYNMNVETSIKKRYPMRQFIIVVWVGLTIWAFQVESVSCLYKDLLNLI